jgi:hypothetical protein
MCFDNGLVIEELAELLCNRVCSMEASYQSHD